MFIPFGRRSVASITSSLTRMVEDLLGHANVKLAELEKHSRLADEARSEHAKATAAADKISTLLS